MKIALGCDHGGFTLKEDIKKYLEKNNHEVIDVGTYDMNSCAYSEFALKCAEKVASGECDRGIVICTTGEGIMIAANKVKGIRCGLAYNNDTVYLMREHNNCNMMSMGAKFTSSEQAYKYIDLFLNTPFEGGRHESRINIISDYEKNN